MHTSRRAICLRGVSLRISAAALLLFVVCQCQAAQRYSASGVVLQVDRRRQSLKISCREIPGYMAAMVMDFPVRAVNELDGISPGVMVDFTLVVAENSAYAQSIRIHQFQSTDQEPMAARQLSLVSKLVDSEAGTTKPLTVGQRVPDFSLISDKREPIKLSQFAGKIIAITFLYTHCPLPNYCYRLSNNFAIVQKRFAMRMGRDLVLLSVTFDPEHDQPDVLAQYAGKNWKAADAQGWYFLTGPLREIQRVSLEFGMNFWQDEGLITHALHTIVLDRNAQLVANLEGNEFTAQQLGDLLESLLRGST
jgi:protein SCO1